MFLKLLSGMADSVEPDLTAPLVCTICICHFVRNFGVQNFRTFTIIDVIPLEKDIHECLRPVLGHWQAV